MTWKITKVFVTDTAPRYHGTDGTPPELPLPTGGVYDAACDLPHRFQLFDDDGNVYYEGRSSSADDDDAFDPLDWAESDSGCTYIEYQQADGTWEIL